MDSPVNERFNIKDPEVIKDLPEDVWMIRPCDTYESEYKECKSYVGRFYQHFIQGEYTECSKWKHDHQNCLKFMKTLDPTVAEKIIENEKERREKRLSASCANDIWEYRTEPPANWSGPLPDWCKKETSVQMEHQENLRRKKGVDNTSEKKSFCIIS
ncbi:synaptic plasticity regulator PANTS-like [Tubulanus polymorphus]|uniref:synaptic plasticity regulator PANTS-like n=1 Tax=Tubulanus polymorphus TaxID=672921 RepID=UPI003DA1FA6B